MTTIDWQFHLKASHVILTDEDLQEVHREFGSDPNEVVLPAPKPSGLTYVDQYGFDMRCGDSLLQRRPKGSALRLLSAPSSQEVVKTEKVDKPKQSSSTKIDKTYERPTTDDKRPLPKRWKVCAASQERNFLAFRFLLEALPFLIRGVFGAGCPQAVRGK
jgi:hypothetical protein